MAKGEAARARRLRDALLGVLLATLAGYWLAFHTLMPGPALRSYSADPEMAYFLTSLAPFKGAGYAFVHHPGTPVELLGSGLLALTYPFMAGDGEGFVAAHLRRPQVFFTMAHALLALAAGAGLVVVGRRAIPVSRGTDALAAAALAAMPLALSPLGPDTLVYWSHNSFTFPAGTLLALVLVLAAARPEPLRSGVVVALGLVAGALAATQLYLATHAVGLAVAGVVGARWSGQRWPRALGPGLLAGGAAAAGFVLSTLPVLPLYPEMLAFVGGLVLHQGLYGSGARGLMGWTGWSANLRFLWGQAPVLLAAGTAIATALVAMAWRRRRDAGAAAWWAAAAALALQWLLTLLLLAKHPSRFYLPALAALLPVLCAVAYRRLRPRPGPASLAWAAASIAVLALFAHKVVRSVEMLRARSGLRTAVESAVDDYLARAAAQGGPSAPTLLLWAPGIPDRPCFPLWFGNQFTGRAFDEEISRVCPGQGFAWEPGVVVPRGWPLREGGRAVIVTGESGPLAYPSLAALGPPQLVPVSGWWGRLAFYPVAVAGGDPVRLVRSGAAAPP